MSNFLDQAGLSYLWTKILAAIESHSVTLPDKLVSYKAAMAITATEKLNADTLGGYSATYFAKSADVSTIQETIRTQASEILKAQQAVSSMGSTVSSLVTNVSTIQETIRTQASEILKAQQAVSSMGSTVSSLVTNKASSVHAAQHAAGGSDPITPESIGAVGYNTAQNLTDTQKMRARGNINAADGTFKTVHLDKIGWYRIATCNFSGSGILSLHHGWGSGGPSSLKFLVTMDAYAPALKCIDTDCFQPQFTNARLVTVAKNLIAIDVYYNIAYDNSPVICFIQTGENSVAIQEPSYISDSDTLPNGETLLLPMEYLNPPMKLGVEYRTTERYLGKPVYVSLRRMGACSAGESIASNAGLASIAKIVSVSGFAEGANSGKGIALPHLYGVPGTNDFVRYSISLSVQLSASGTGDVVIGIGCGAGRSFNSADVLIKYTKTTD